MRASESVARVHSCKLFACRKTRICCARVDGKPLTSSVPLLATLGAYFANDGALVAASPAFEERKHRRDQRKFEGSPGSASGRKQNVFG